jgi:formylglycine-generating enzyme required for sulfatase activity
LLKYHGWHHANGGNRTWPVGLLKPNDPGMFDMRGNVEEWSGDSVCFSKDVEENLLRGSCAFEQPEDVRAARPGPAGNSATYRGTEGGMRLARTLPEPSPPRQIPGANTGSPQYDVPHDCVYS